MADVYVALESLAALVILLLIYANVFEGKQNSRKRRLFTQLLIANEVVVVADAISWLHLGWEKYPMLLAALITVTYVVPTVMKIIFSMYLYEHIARRIAISKKPFTLIVYYSIAEGIVTLLMCVSEKLYTIRDGVYYSGLMEPLYYLLNLISIMVMIGIVVCSGKKMSLHDTLAVLPFCVVPLISLVVTLAFGINVSVVLMSISMLIMYIMLQSENESILFGRVNVDELTGINNRRAYEDEMLQDPNIRHSPNLVYASIDVNGLKQVNDTLGHSAGDEIVRGAAECINSVFGKEGKVFRIGGDEFVAIFFADDSRMKKMTADLEMAVNQWRGNQVSSLSLSVGYVTRREFPEATSIEIARIADKRMYKAKDRYYADMGMDRRGQNDAHKVLCSLYTKILKINITDNTFTVINMNIEERKKELGYDDTISGWLDGFGRSGQVHPDDLEDYLAKVNLDYMRNYFRRGKTSLTIMYRRKYGDQFKQVMMEIIPTNEYTDADQSMYLYVKNIDV